MHRRLAGRFPTPESRACILVGRTQEVTLLKTGKKRPAM
ncbi:hypothetical protein C4K40_4136 [Pseudomonas sp. CMR5c]|nr:hypothetical protein C4K40_4136 [Pseudomonas sp. CMR5c]